MTTNYPTPYKKGNLWYFKYTDGSHERKNMSTGCSKKTEAEKFIRHFIDSLTPYGNSETLREIVKLYTDTDTNPRFADKQATGGQYGHRYASHVTRDAKTILGLSLPMLDLPLHRISRRHVKDAAITIVNSFGKSHKSRNVYKLLKIILSQAADDGLVMVSPSQGLPDIKPETREKTVLPSEQIRKVIESNYFPDEYTRDVFITMVSTGLRRSEFLALTPSQIIGNTLKVDRAYKDDSCKIIGPPKWDKIRILYLPEIAKNALQRIFSEKTYIDLTTKSLAKRLSIVGAHAAEFDERWRTITPHVLRRSLNTMLRLSGLADVMVSEYMSWEHQVMVQGDMIDVYTKLYAENLKPVANMIDMLLQSGQGEENEKAIDSGFDVGPMFGTVRG